MHYTAADAKGTLGARRCKPLVIHLSTYRSLPPRCKFNKLLPVLGQWEALFWHRSPSCGRLRRVANNWSLQDYYGLAVADMPWCCPLFLTVAGQRIITNGKEFSCQIGVEGPWLTCILLLIMRLSFFPTEYMALEVNCIWRSNLMPDQHNVKLLLLSASYSS